MGPAERGQAHRLRLLDRLCAPLYGKNTGKYYEIDFRPQDLHDCIYDDFDGDPLAAVEAYFAEVEKVAAMGPDILAHIDLIKKLNAAGEFFDEESPRYKAAALKR